MIESILNKDGHLVTKVSNPLKLNMEELHRYDPVSYTHLDVYKRQSLQRLVDLMYSQVTMYGRTTPTTVSLLLSWAVGGVVALVAVSFWMVVVPLVVAVVMSAVACCMCLKQRLHKLLRKNK